MGYSTSFVGKFEFDKELPSSVVVALDRICGNDTRDLKTRRAYPGFFCQWTFDDHHLFWDGGEKFTEYVEWLQWIIDNILKPAGVKLLGQVAYHGEEVGDSGVIVVGHDQIVVKNKLEPISDHTELLEFRAFVLASEFGGEILELWNNR